MYTAFPNFLLLLSVTIIATEVLYALRGRFLTTLWHDCRRAASLDDMHGRGL